MTMVESKVDVNFGFDLTWVRDTIFTDALDGTLGVVRVASGFEDLAERAYADLKAECVVSDVIAERTTRR